MVRGLRSCCTPAAASYAFSAIFLSRNRSVGLAIGARPRLLYQIIQHRLRMVSVECVRSDINNFVGLHFGCYKTGIHNGGHLLLLTALFLAAGSFGLLTFF
jgi:hypothetical protein